jgi:hypothetical protein
MIQLGLRYISRPKSSARKKSTNDAQRIYGSFESRILCKGTASSLAIRVRRFPAYYRNTVNGRVAEMANESMPSIIRSTESEHDGPPLPEVSTGTYGTGLGMIRYPGICSWKHDLSPLAGPSSTSMSRITRFSLEGPNFSGFPLHERFMLEHGN